MSTKPPFFLTYPLLRASPYPSKHEHAQNFIHIFIIREEVFGDFSISLDLGYDGYADQDLVIPVAAALLADASVKCKFGYACSEGFCKNSAGSNSL